MAKISKAVRRGLAEAQNWRCAYCTAGTEASGPLMATVDHVVPQGAGGGAARLNLVSACPACNAARGADIDIWTFWKIRSRLRESGLWPPGQRPCAEVANFLKAHRAYTRSKIALRRRAAARQAPSAELLINELVDMLNEGCTLTALQITRLRLDGRRCGYALSLLSRLGASNAEREAWDCLWYGVLDRRQSPDRPDAAGAPCGAERQDRRTPALASGSK